MFQSALQLSHLDHDKVYSFPVQLSQILSDFFVTLDFKTQLSPVRFGYFYLTNNSNFSKEVNV